MPSTASAEARARRTASSPPQAFFSDTNFAHQLRTKPPLRPLAPAPHTSPSTNTTSDAGSCSFNRIADQRPVRSEEHTSELQSRLHLVCRLLLEKKKKIKKKLLKYRK